MAEVLSTREVEILGSIIKTFIEKATPVGSRYLSKYYHQNMSPATIRNVMMDLEDKGFISQPHTSAGRVPTEKAYRYYVDDIMELEELSPHDIRRIREDLKSESNDVDKILQKSCQGLSKISNLIGVVLSPRLFSGILRKIDLVSLSENMILIILSVEAGLVKTITMEVQSSIPKYRLEQTAQILNERLEGLTIQQIHESIGNRMRDVSIGDDELIQQFINSADKLFVFENEHIHLGGTKNIVEQPEFSDKEQLQRILELIDNQKVLIHILNDYAIDEKITIMIGNETQKEIMKNCSLITAKYKIGSISGTLGVIGPIRMHYPKMITLVDYIAKEISNLYSK
ncbi:heat-inducible transcription repressor HrcA [candidate division KSB1 bacterium]|nr:heat-inducible transcription repressor HrcA [candidate division KSB1 bacterium]